MTLSQIKQTVFPGVIIPKPLSKQVYVVVGWGRSRGEEALVYRLPPKPNTKKASTKRIPASVFEEANKELRGTGQITRVWFQRSFPVVDADGDCNFTTLGGVFELLGRAVYARPGVYKKVSKPASPEGTGI